MKKRIISLISFICILCAGCGDTSLQKKDSQTQIDQETDLTLPEEVAEAETEVETYTEQVEFSIGSGNKNYYLIPFGLQQYDSFKGEKFTDTPAEDSVYLVLYLKMQNLRNEPYYFNADFFTATVDGKEIPVTYLLNDIEKFEPLFNYMPSGETVYRYVAFEVPENWKTFEFKYTGWEMTEHAIVEGSFTSDDLKEPNTDEI